MSHQVLISFDIDENKVQENAEKEAGRQIAKVIVDKAFGDTSYYINDKMRAYVSKVIAEMLEPQKDAIISEAIKNVTDAIKRSKALKDKIGDIET